MNRRLFLRGLVAAPAVVAASSLMPIRGLVMPWKPMPNLLKLLWHEEVVWTAGPGDPFSRVLYMVHSNITRRVEGSTEGWLRWSSRQHGVRR
jgi:hypothetical protein